MKLFPKSFLRVFVGTTLLAQVALFAQEKTQLIKTYEKALEKFQQGDFRQGHLLLDECLKADSLWKEVLFSKAFFEMEEGRYQEAEKRLSKIISHYPTDTASYLARAQAKAQQQKFQQAFSDINKVLQMDSTHVQALIDMGFVHCLARYPKKAQLFLDKALSYAPNNLQALQLKAYAYWLDKDLKKAENLVYKTLTLNPENIEAQKLKAYILFDKENYNEAIRIFEQILKKDPHAFQQDDFYYWAMALYKTQNYKQALLVAQSPKKIENAELYHIQALCYFQQKKHTEAWNALLSAEKIETNLPAEFYYNKAIIAHYLQKKQEAKQNYLKALSLMPELYLLRNEKDEKAEVLVNANPIFQKEFSKDTLNSLLVSAYQERSLNLLEENETKQALQNIQKAIDIDSLNSKSYVIRAIAKGMEAKFQEANQDFEKAEKLPKQRDLGYLYLMRGLVAAEAQNIGQAVFYIDKAIAHNPLQANYYAEKAHLLFEIGDSEGAFQNINKAILLAPHEVSFRLDKINYLYEEERYDEVLQECENTLKINPDAVEVYYYRGVAYGVKKNKTQAVKDLKFFLQYYPDDKDAQKALNLLE